MGNEQPGSIRQSIIGPRLKSKAYGCLLGAIVGDAICLSNDKAFHASAAGMQVLCSAKALSAGMDKFLPALATEMTTWYEAIKDGKVDRMCDEATWGVLVDGTMKTEDGWKRSGLRGYCSSGPMPRAIPIGAVFHDDPGVIVELSRGACSLTHEDTTPQCGTVATAMLVSYAMGGIPSGLWANELSGFVSGIDPEVLRAVQQAAQLASSPTPEVEAMKSIGDGSDPASALGLAIYICTRAKPKDMLRAMKMARSVRDRQGACVVGSIVGACFGARNAVEEGSSVELADEVSVAVDKLAGVQEAGDAKKE